MNGEIFALNDLEHRALKTLCTETFATRQAVDTVNFRADHEEFRPVMRRLHTLRYINEDNSSQAYVPTILGLHEVGTRDCNRILELGSKLLVIFRDHYRNKETRKTPLLLSDLAARLDIDRTELNFSMWLLTSLTSPVVNGRSLTPEGSDAYVRVDEHVYDYPDVESVIALYEGYRNQALAPTSPLGPLDERPSSNATPQSTFGSELIAALPEQFRQLAGEIDAALSGNLSSLPVMGLRALLDMYCSDVVGGDIGGFKEKIERIKEEDLLHSREVTLLEAALEVAHAASHRMHVPKPEECRKVLGITVHLLGERYLLSPNAQQLRDSAPPRERRR